MEFIRMLIDTSLWVWGALAFFVDVGIRSVHQHVVYLPKLFFIPLVMVILKYGDIVATPLQFVLFISCTIISSIVAVMITKKMHIQINKKSFTIQLPGSYVTFSLLMIFFVSKFLMSYIAVILEISSSYLQIFDIILSGILTGYFVGRACLFTYKFVKHS